jgi:hypothetical protein
VAAAQGTLTRAPGARFASRRVNETSARAMERAKLLRFGLTGIDVQQSR